MRPLRVVAIFELGLYEYDSALAYTSIANAQQFAEIGGRVSGIEVRLTDVYQARRVSRELGSKLGLPYWTRDWTEMNRNLFSAIQLEKTAMFVILTLIICVAAFAIISHLILMVAEKRRRSACSGALGALAEHHARLHGGGVLIGLVGTTVGTVLGVAIGLVQDRYHLVKIPGDVYQLSELPMKMHPPEMTLIAVAALGLSFLATIYPSRQAARLHPVEVLRYE
jgi:lipoprotein-releasing system permease protein